MQRIPEPELMEDMAQARAYALADFAEPHDHFVALFRQHFPDLPANALVLDLGCGPADVTCRFAHDWPECHLHGVDGAAAMLHYGEQRLAEQGLDGRITLIHGVLPGVELPYGQYDVVISNSLLHHLADPQVLWQSVKRYASPGAPIFVMDLMRPADRAAAQAMQRRYAAGEPEVLQADFYHSLLAAYTPDEVRAQLQKAALSQLVVTAISDRHLIIAGHC